MAIEEVKISELTPVETASRDALIPFSLADFSASGSLTVAQIIGLLKTGDLPDLPTLHASSVVYNPAANDLTSEEMQGAIDEVVVLIDALNTALAGASADPGAVQDFAMTTPPTGWLEQDGSELSRTTYADLFAAIGTTFGAGDGSTTFLIPDTRGEFRRGWDNSRGIDVSRVFGSLQLDAFQGHAHTHSATYGGQSGTYGKYVGNNGATDTSAPVTDGVNGTPRTAAETRGRNIAFLTCIKY